MGTHRVRGGGGGLTELEEGVGTHRVRGAGGDLQS